MLNALIEKKMKELPANIQHAIKTFDWAEEISHIAEKHNLSIGSVEILRRETLLVIVGLIDAVDFEKNLTQHMNISHELAEKLVYDANEHIFMPLRRLAFTPHQEEEIIEHEQISNIMKDEGLILVDESEPREHPQNELQDLADSLFNINSNTHNTENKQEIEETHKEKEEEKKPINYHEPIEESDLVGITEHRIDTSILENNNSQITNETQYTQDLDAHRFSNIHVSKTESFDMSPTKEEQIIERGDFLKHIGAV